MNCAYTKRISRYADNELPQKEKEFLDKHIFTCPPCLHELKAITSIKERILKNKVDTNAGFFWQTLKKRIDTEARAVSTKEMFSLDFGSWAKRLIPVPIFASLLVLAFLTINARNSNLIDEYIFTNKDSSVLELMDNAGSQSEINILLYNQTSFLRSQSIC